MGGIAGIIRFDGAPVAAELVDGMTAAMAHRGPDGSAHWGSGSVALGHCMMRTTPESLEESQPAVGEGQDVVLVMDGRVDNWAELRSELLSAGANLRNRSDAELVLRSYEAWGEECLRHIDGDFALVVWDARRRRAFCARDRTGGKPFYYFSQGGKFAFASELHPLLGLPWVEERPNEGMLAEFLGGSWFSADETLWSNLMRLPAANAMVVDAAGARRRRYWTPDLNATLPYRRDEEYFDHYRELLTDRVRRMSRSHLPLAMEVSGGLDSSAIFSIAERLRRDGQLLAPAALGYTLTVAGDTEADEVEYARAVARSLGTPIEEVPASILPASWYEERAAFYRDFPGFANASMFEDLRQRSAARGCRVTLGGEGGDTWLEGTRHYYAEEIRHGRWTNLRDCLSADAADCGWPRAMWWLAKYGVFPLLPQGIQPALSMLRRRPAPGGQPAVPFWLSDRMLDVFRDREVAAPSIDASHAGPGRLELKQRLDDAFNAQVLERYERDAARAGIEMRLPFQSAPLIEFLFALPERLRLRGGTSKFIHTRALRGVVCDTVLDRRSKAEFSGIVVRQLIALRAEISGPLAQRRSSWLDSGGISRLCGALEAQPRYGWPLWVLWAIYGCDLALGGASARVGAADK